MSTLQHPTHKTSPNAAQDKPLKAVHPIPIAIDSPPQSFRERFRDECIQGSAIDPNLFEVAIDFLEDSGRWEPYDALGWKVHTQWQTRRPHNFGLLGCFRNEDRSVWQAKPQNPRIDTKKASPQKYETPVGNGSRAYTPAITVGTWVKIADRAGMIDRLPDWVKRAHDNGHHSLKSGSTGFGVDLEQSSFWKWIEQFPDLEITLTEGAKKSLCLLSHGYVAIGLYGVNGGYRSNIRIGGEPIPLKQPELIDDLVPFIVPGRPIVLAFDQDSKVTTRQKVSTALDRFGGLLEQCGSIVRIAEWDGARGKGVDDLIVAAGLEAWEQAHTEALTFGEWQALHELQKRLTRKPDLHIGDREFVAVADRLPTQGLVALCGGKGTAKSKAIGLMLAGRSWVSITPLQSLGRDQAASWGGVFINDGDIAGDRLLKDGQPVDGAAVCIPSLCKVSRLTPDVVVIDELTAGLRFLLGSPLANRQGIRSVLLAEFARLIQFAQLVIVADADLSEAALRHIEALRGERAYLIQSTRKPNPYDAYLIDGNLNEAIAMLQARVAGLEPNQLIAIHSDSKSQAESLARLLGERETLLITSETSGGDCEQDFLTSKGRLIPSGVRFVVCSPSVTQGFSIEHHTDRYDSVWGFYSGASISAEDIGQSLERVRAQLPRFVHCGKRGSAYSSLSKAETLGAFLRDFQRLSTVTARLVRHSLSPEAIAVSDRIDWQSQNLKMLAAIETRRNRGMRALRDTVSALLRHEGKRVHHIKPTISKAQARAAGDALKGVREALKIEYAQAIAAAIDLTPEQAKRLEALEALTPEQTKQLEKHYIQQFYRLQSVTEQDVAFDRKGRTRRRIRAIEAVLDEVIAMERTASSIEQSPGCPQDWDRTQVKRWLLEQSGAGQLIRDIYAGEVINLTPDIIGPIVAFIRAHEAEFKLAFGFKSIARMMDQQLIGEVLAAHAIQTKRNQRKGFYAIDTAHLERIREIVEHRKKAVSPLQDLKVDQRGDTASKPLQISEPSASGRGAIDDLERIPPLGEDEIDGGFYEFIPESA